MRLPLLAALLLAAPFPAAAPATADVFPFSMPSRNVDCTVGQGDGPSDIVCVIFDRSGPPPRPVPAGCAGGWGHVYAMQERGPVEMRCGGPGGKNTAAYVEIAPYGQTGRFGGITCLSQETGLTCSNADGHGFRLSRRVQEVW
jgi:hypothetical protein